MSEHFPQDPSQDPRLDLDKTQKLITPTYGPKDPEETTEVPIGSRTMTLLKSLKDSLLTRMSPGRSAHRPTRAEETIGVRKQLENMTILSNQQLLGPFSSEFKQAINGIEADLNPDSELKRYLERIVATFEEKLAKIDELPVRQQLKLMYRFLLVMEQIATPKSTWKDWWNIGQLISEMALTSLSVKILGRGHFKEMMSHFWYEEVGRPYKKKKHTLSNTVKNVFRKEKKYEYKIIYPKGDVVLNGEGGGYCTEFSIPNTDLASIAFWQLRIMTKDRAEADGIKDPLFKDYESHVSLPERDEYFVTILTGDKPIKVSLKRADLLLNLDDDEILKHPQRYVDEFKNKFLVAYEEAKERAAQIEAEKAAQIRTEVYELIEKIKAQTKSEKVNKEVVEQIVAAVTDKVERERPTTMAYAYPKEQAGQRVLDRKIKAELVKRFDHPSIADLQLNIHQPDTTQITLDDENKTTLDALARTQNATHSQIRNTQVVFDISYQTNQNRLHIGKKSAHFDGDGNRSEYEVKALGQKILADKKASRSNEPFEVEEITRPDGKIDHLERVLPETKAQLISDFPAEEIPYVPLSEEEKTYSLTLDRAKYEARINKLFKGGQARSDEVRNSIHALTAITVLALTNKDSIHYAERVNEPRAVGPAYFRMADNFLEALKNDQPPNLDMMRRTDALFRFFRMGRALVNKGAGLMQAFAVAAGSVRKLMEKTTKYTDRSNQPRIVDTASLSMLVKSFFEAVNLDSEDQATIILGFTTAMNSIYLKGGVWGAIDTPDGMRISYRTRNKDTDPTILKEFEATFEKALSFLEKMYGLDKAKPAAA